MLPAAPVRFSIDDRLAPFARKPVADQPRNGVGGSAGGEGHDDLDRTVRIVFRARRATGHADITTRSASARDASAGPKPEIGCARSACDASSRARSWPRLMTTCLDTCKDTTFRNLSVGCICIEDDDDDAAPPCRDRRRRDRRPVRGQCTVGARYPGGRLRTGAGDRRSRRRRVPHPQQRPASAAGRTRAGGGEVRRARRSGVRVTSATTARRSRRCR